MKVLISGASSLPGYKTALAFLERGHEVIALHLSHDIQFFTHLIEKVRVDITDYRMLSKVFDRYSPDVVVHMAAYGNVDGCEVKRELAWNVNVNGTINVAKLANKYSTQIIYLSTDYVFDGFKGGYQESDAPNPVNYYGLTKLCGEVAVSSLNIDYSIVRASSIYGFGPGKKNFAKILVEKLIMMEEVKALVDQYTTPTLASLLAEAIVEIVERQVIGVFHIVGERLSRYEFAIKVADALNLDKRLVMMAEMKDFSWVAPRPKDSSLNCEFSRKLLKTDFYSMDKALTILRREYEGLI